MLRSWLLVCLAPFGSLSASVVADAVWVGGNGSSWNEPSNWGGNAVPNPQFGEAVVINNGDVVEYFPGGVDFTIDSGGSLNLSALSGWTQSTTHWTRINNGTLTLESSTFLRPLGGHLVVGYNNNTTAVLSIIGKSEVSLGGELWLGHNTNLGGHVSTININDSKITADGEVGVWAWDYDGPGNAYHINFSGSAGSFIDVSDRIGLRRTGQVRENQVTWEEYWDLGILTAEGKSGLTGDVFSDYFTTTGTSAADGLRYVLTYTPVPEPAGAALLAVGGWMLARRRRRA